MINGALADELCRSLRGRRSVPPLMGRCLHLTVASKAVQEMLARAPA